MTMTPAILMGSALVLATWAVIVFAVPAVGRWVPVVLERDTPGDAVWRAGLWWGLSLLTLAVVVVNIWSPLGSTSAAAWLAGIGIVSAGIGMLLRRPRAPRWRRPTRPMWLYLSALAAGTVYLAAKALGPVTNYDTGLYHLGAVKYAHDFATIPGLANLYFPFGYSNAQFPLAAFLGNGPWDGVGYRLLNGAVVLLALVELSSRLLNRRWRWGTFTLLVGMSACLVPLIGMADGLVTSPTSDTSVLILTTVSAAYLADALQRREGLPVNLSVAVVLAGLLVMLRPTMVVFAALTVVIALILIVRRRPIGAGFWILTPATLVAMAAATIVRDRILSGWLAYPLSLAHFDVPWVANDPTPWRTATLAAARDPQAPDGYVVAHSWQWLGPWVSRVMTQWEGWFLLGGLLVAVVVVVVAHRMCSFPQRPRLLVAALLPSAGAVLAWFILSPPSFRFIWGPLFSLLFLPIGLALAELRRSGWRPAKRLDVCGAALLACGAAVLGVTGYSALARNQLDTIATYRTWSLGPVQLTYAVTPITQRDVSPVTMSTGLVLYSPADGNDQCWDNYPLCGYNMGTDVALRGSSIQDGFTQARPPQ